MTATLEDRVTILEVKVEHLETFAGPGQNDAFSGHFRELRKEFDKFGKAQAKMQGTLDRHTGQIEEVKSKLSRMSLDLDLVLTEVSQFKAEVAGRLTRVDSDVAELKSDVTTLKSDVTTLKSDVTTLKSDVTDLKDNLTVVEVNLGELREEVTGRLDRVDGALAEILDRLPPKAA